MSLLVRIDRYLRTTGMPPTVFGRRAANDPRLISDIRRGRTLGNKISARIETLLDSGQD